MNSDLVIIGGGIIGLYSAYLLTQRGVNLTIIERGSLGHESSWVAGGILAPLLPWHYDSQVFYLTTNSAKSYQQLSQKLHHDTGIDIEFWNCGLTVYDFLDETITTWCTHNNLRIHSSTPSQQQFHLPDIAQVRTPRLISALVKYLTENNVTLLTHTSASQLLLQNNRIIGVDTSAGRIKTDKVLCANGAWLSELSTSNPNISLPSVKPVKGQLVAIQAQPGLLKTIKYKNGLYIIPRKDGLIISGSTLENTGYDKSTTLSARQELYNSAISMIPELRDFPISHQWAGLRPATMNNIPTIGPHQTIRGLYLNCGHFRYGVAMAPTSAEIITQWICNNGASLGDQERKFTHHKHPS